ncbi:MAG: 50S ribosomal protein L24 [Verrucomicrobiota bacterium]|nr:50S ribosomal protein L24 [Verrucomicrobiota bacterium]
MPSRFHIKKGEIVVVISGDEKGKRGKILEILAKKDRLIVEGLNLIKKHVRKTQKDPQGGIITREGTIHISNVMLAEKYDNSSARKAKAA